MALPKLNDVPKYDIVIPSTKMKTRFRPYLVKEEKILLLALENGDIDKISNTVIDLIKTCVSDPINEKDLTTYDMDYLFCQIRSKSVGETVKLLIRCEDEECRHQTEVSVDLSKVGVDLPEKIDNMIEISPNIFVEMKHLSYYDLLHSIGKNDKTETAFVFDSVLNSIKAVHTEDERVDVKEESKESLENFVNSMTSSQYNKLKKFVLNAPRVSHNAEWDCASCGRHQTMKLEGLQDFFQ
jgi:hypothetical protein